ncbi:TetR/AcrR family transcriptional regulator [Pseudonocardia kujensis]|uniref:TetR/AcrR family transcriptional regulator n=1 Tax=Pseudonocardia kujensis TaxID=1128675 RepID=UPI001E2F5FB5|nr:helix-turn-helix domain-containing protein [Pseudonocardia kujensis]MCE0761445.1 TetR/AcrR family transcriptional regulator [Pseudonocardia kujensis]
MPDVNGSRRTYHSPVRAEAARRTRQAIVAAAAELFVERGYGAASLRDVARVAGVARPTVAAAFGSKPALLRQVLDEALAGDDEPVPVAQRPWFAPVWQATDPGAVLDAYAEVCTLIGRRAARIFEVVHQGAGDAAEVGGLWTMLTRNRRAGAEMVARHTAETGPLRPGLAMDQAIDHLWILNNPAHYADLVLERHWPEHDFRQWLAHQMRAGLLGPDHL